VAHARTQEPKCRYQLQHQLLGEVAFPGRHHLQQSDELPRPGTRSDGTLSATCILHVSTLADMGKEHGKEHGLMHPQGLAAILSWISSGLGSSRLG
jgi:hypothetical protein